MKVRGGSVRSEEVRNGPTKRRDRETERMRETEKEIERCSGNRMSKVLEMKKEERNDTFIKNNQIQTQIKR